MIKKSMMWAAVAAVGLVASADVYEVKFSVKVDADGKVTSRKINGLYDSTTGRNAFWTKKGKNVTVYDGTYFGFANQATAGAKVGLNAELSWGTTAADPENDLIAGAWGTAKSKSGQVAGLFNGKPANGSWSARVNTRKTYDELLAAAGVAQTSNTSTSPVAEVKAQSAAAVKAAEDKAAADIAAAEEAAAAKVAAAEEKAAAAVAEGKAAEEQAAAEVAAAKEQAAAEVAAAKEQAEKDVAAAKEAADAAIAEAKAAADEELAKKAAELEGVQGVLDGLVDSLVQIEESDTKNMVSTYLENKMEWAQELKEESQAVIDKVEDAYTTYTNSLNEAAMEQAVADAQAVVDDLNAQLTALKQERKELVYTNSMLVAIYDGTIKDKFAEMKEETQEQIDEVEGLIADAETFEAYTNRLTTVVIPNRTKKVEKAKTALDDAKTALDEAQAKYDEACAALDPYVEPTYENGGLLSYDQWVEENGLDGTALEVQLAYDQYKADTIAADKAAKEQAKKEAKEALKEAQDAYDEAEVAYEDAVASLEEAKQLLADAIASGTTPRLAKLQEKLDALKAKLASLDDELKFWLAYKYSDDEKEAIAAQIRDLNKQIKALNEDLETAETALQDAKDALENLPETQADNLAALSEAIEADPALETTEKLEAIRAKVDAYLEPYQGYVTLADKTITSIETIQAKMAESKAETQE